MTAEAGLDCFGYSMNEMTCEISYSQAGGRVMRHDDAG
jgi:hypothetical protein